MKKYICSINGYVTDENKGDKKNNLSPEIKREEIP
jgi:rubredoxin